MKPAGVVVLISFILVLRVTPALGDPPARTIKAVPLLTIGKCQNKKQGQYAVHADDHCVPMPDAPVFALLEHA